MQTKVVYIMLISKKRSNSTPPVHPQSFLDGTVLSQVTSYKYLGVTITHDLSWKPHISSISNKTRKPIGMIYRKYYRHSDPTTLLRLYLTIIRPNLEYACPVWDPSYKAEINALENVQKFGLRICVKSWYANYDDLLQQLKVPSLEMRRMRMRLCHLFKIMKQMTFFPDAPIIPRALDLLYKSRSTHSNAIFIPRAKSLPEDVTNVNTSYYHI